MLSETTPVNVRRHVGCFDASSPIYDTDPEADLEWLEQIEGKPCSPTGITGWVIFIKTKEALQAEGRGVHVLLFPENEALRLNPRIQHRGLKVYQICLDADPRMTFDLTAMSNMRYYTKC